jgi:hypothetical protein
MKAIKFHNRILILLFLLSGLTFAISAQNVPHSPINETLISPPSEVLVTLKFTLPDGNWIYATQREGSIIRVEKGNSVYIFTPIKNNYGDIKVNVQVVRKTNQAFPELKASKYYKTLSEFIESNPPFSTEINKIRSVSKINSGSGNSLEPNLSSGSSCCITCSGVTTCACAVQASCGSCCVGGCC